LGHHMNRYVPSVPRAGSACPRWNHRPKTSLEIPAGFECAAADRSSDRDRRHSPSHRRTIPGPARWTRNISRHIRVAALGASAHLQRGPGGYPRRGSIRAQDAAPKKMAASFSRWREGAQRFQIAGAPAVALRIQSVEPGNSLPRNQNVPSSPPNPARPFKTFPSAITPPPRTGADDRRDGSEPVVQAKNLWSVPTARLHCHRSSKSPACRAPASRPPRKSKPFHCACTKLVAPRELNTPAELAGPGVSRPDHGYVRVRNAGFRGGDLEAVLNLTETHLRTFHRARRMLAQTFQQKVFLLVEEREN